MTQENLANILGVMNQTVSKWEAAQSCPDIQLFVYRLVALLHEAAMTDGYKRKMPWQENKDYSIEEVKSWGLSICSEAEGSTGKNNSIFFTLAKGYVSPKHSDLRQMIAFLKSTRT